MGSGDKDLVSNKLTVILIGMGSAGILVSLYHCISVALCRYHSRSITNRRFHGGSSGGGDVVSDNLRSIEISTIELIPTHIYKKDGIEEGEEVTCSICLCEFEKGEKVRCLPECGHYFHVACIDMWLYTHLSCPICRADATPPPSILSAPASTEVAHHPTMEHVVQV